MRDWTVTIRAGILPLSTFGVYPLAAEVESGGAVLSTDHTFLPFWPGSRAAAGLTQRMKIAWIWPVFSAPEKAACPALLNNVLASSLTAGGRLGLLLAAGSTPEAVRADLTWAIDPSVLSSAAVMRQAYQVGGNATCSGAVSKRASPAARSWLARLRSVTTQQDYFVTPYADVDVSALTHAGLITDLKRAQDEGNFVAGKFLGGTAASRGRRGGPIAWPAAGIADFGVLGSLAANGVSSVILNSSLMPPRTALLYTPSAITSALDGVDAGVHVALADNILSQVLADGPTAAQAHRAQARTQSASGRSAGGQSASTVQAAAAAGSFATEQRFLAETAMIAAEAPATPRSVVIAPPRQWNPTESLATALLTESDDAPWLKPASVSSLITANSSAGQVPRVRPPGTKFGPGELHRSLLRKVKGLEASIRLQASMFGQQPSSLPGRRRGRGGIGGLAGPPPPRESPAGLGVRLPGRAGTAGPHHRHRAGHPDREVRPRPGIDQQPAGRRSPCCCGCGRPAGRMTVHPPVTTVTIGPHQQRTVVIKVRSAVAGSTVLRLSLAAPNGAPLPGTQAKLTVDATHFGTTALVIVAIAIAVFVVTAIARAIRPAAAPAAPCCLRVAVPALLRTLTVRNLPDRPAKRIPSCPSLPVSTRHPRSRMSTPAPQAGWTAPDGGRGRRRASGRHQGGATPGARAMRAAA